MRDEYDRLRSIGCSVETADALAPIVSELEGRKKFAFYLWATGMEQQDAARIAGISRHVVQRFIRKMERVCRESVLIV